MLRKILLFVSLFAVSLPAYSNAYFDLGEKYFNNKQYTSAIEQFKNSLRQYPNDYKSRIALINAYSARATYYNNTLKDFQKALNDSRSALYYLKYCDKGAINPSLQNAMLKFENNIKELNLQLKTDNSVEGLYNSAKRLRIQSELPSSFIVYQQLMNTKYDREATLASGDILRILKNPTEAIVYYDKALKADPNNYNLLIKIGECYQEIGKAELAAEKFNKALSVSKNSDLALSNLEKVWRQQIYKNPADAEAHANLGVIYQQKGDFSLALQEYQKALRLKPASVNTKLNLGTLYQAQNKFSEAISQYDLVIYSDPSNVNARKFKAQCLESLGKDEEALIEYKRVLDLDENNFDAKNAILNLASASGNKDVLNSIVDENLQNNKDKAIAYYNFAYDLHKNKKYNDAKSYYLKSLELNDNQPDAYLNLSDVYYQLKDENSAVKILEDAKLKFPLNNDILNRLKQIKLVNSQIIIEQAGQALLAGQYDKALSLYNSIQPQSEDSLLGIASTYQAMDKLDDAILYYKKASALSPNNSEIAYYIASAYVVKEDYKSAKAYLNSVLVKNPNHDSAKNLMNYISDQELQKNLDLALNLYNEKKYSEAYILLSSMIADNPKNHIIYYYRGLVLDEQKKFYDAINDYKISIKNDSKFDLAYYSLAVDYDTLKKYNEAIEYYNKFLSLTTLKNEYSDFAKKRVEELMKYVQNVAQTE